MIVYTPPRAADHIPLIDLSASFADRDARRAVAWDIHKACRANLHRVRNAASDRARHSVASFFELEPQYRMPRAPTCGGSDPGQDAAILTIGEHIEQMAKASYAA